jgi:hypothetical protein
MADVSGARPFHIPRSHVNSLGQSAQDLRPAAQLWTGICAARSVMLAGFQNRAPVASRSSGCHALVYCTDTMSHVPGLCLKMRTDEKQDHNE